MDLVEDDLGLEALGVLEETVHELGTLHAHRVGGPVVDVGGGHELAALGEPRDEDGLQVGARGVHGGRIAGRSRTEDEEARMAIGHGRKANKTRAKGDYRIPGPARMSLKLRGYLSLRA